MYYLIYKTINLINGKYYIGKHQTQDLEDGYQGSGRLLGRAIKKYGRQNFVTHIIGNYETEKQMNLAEKILVVPDIETNYNLCPGGQGGFGYINDNGFSLGWGYVRKHFPNGMLGKHHSLDTKRSLSDRHRGFNNPNAKVTPEQIVEIRERHAHKVSYSKIGQMFGVSKSQIARIVNNTQW